MTDRLDDLEKEVGKFLKILDEGIKDTGEKTAKGDLPHLELIDFDVLSRSLRELKVCIGEFRELNNQAGVIRNWLINRIAAFDKARSMILARSTDYSQNGDLEKLSLVNLMHRYQEASTSLKRLNDSTRITAIGNPERLRKEYLKYKS